MKFENHDLGASIQGATQDVVVFAILSWVVPAQPELRHQFNNYDRGHPGVHSGGLGYE
jgi:hypothetical protein